MPASPAPHLDVTVKNPAESTTKKDHIPNVGFVSLGCPKALVDSEQIITQLRAEGYAISGTYDGADLVVVNTCGFIDEAVQESLDAIGEALTENGKVIVTGCLSEEGRERQRHHHQRAPEGAGRDRSACAGRGDAGGARICPSRMTRSRTGAGGWHQAHAQALRLPEDFRGLQPSLFLLHHPVDAR